MTHMVILRPRETLIALSSLLVSLASPHKILSTKYNFFLFFSMGVLIGYVQVILPSIRDKYKYLENCFPCLNFVNVDFFFLKKGDKK